MRTTALQRVSTRWVAVRQAMRYQTVCSGFAPVKHVLNTLDVAVIRVRKVAHVNSVGKLKKQA